MGHCALSICLTLMFVGPSGASRVARSQRSTRPVMLRGTRRTLLYDPEFEGIGGRVQAYHARLGVRRAPRQIELHGIRRSEAVE